jgi:hypothetical protein
MGNAPESMVDPNGMQYDSHGIRNDALYVNNRLDNSFAGGDGVSGSGPSGGSGGGGDIFLGTNDIATFYGAQAQSVFARLTGQSSTQGKGKQAINSVDGGGLGSGDGLVPDGAAKVADDGTSSTFRWFTGDITNLEVNYLTSLNQQGGNGGGQEGGIGQPGTGEGFIPIWGPGRAAIDDFQNGRWGWGIFNTAMAVSDVFLVKALYTGIMKAGVMGIGRLSMGGARGVTNTVTKSESVLGHIFRDATGHVNPSTLTSQDRYIRLFENVANNSANINPNILTNFQKTGSLFQGYSQTFRNGSQVWVQTFKDKIINAGVNIIPK